MPTSDFPVVLPVADLDDLLGATDPERIADGLNVAVTQGLAELSTDADGRAVVALAPQLVEQLGLTCEGGHWFTGDAPHRVYQEIRRALASFELRGDGDQPAKRTRKARRRKRKPKRKKTAARPSTTTTHSFSLAALRAQLDGAGGG